MSTHFKWYHSGDLFGVHYTFDEYGDGINLHAHPESETHNIIVLLGAVKFKSEDKVEMLMAGTVFDFDGTVGHSIMAMQDHTQVIHFLRHGMPEFWKTLPESESHGIMEWKQV